MAADGFLVVRAYTSAAELPVSGATVSVTEQSDNGARLIATRITDHTDPHQRAEQKRKSLSGTSDAVHRRQYHGRPFRF